MTRLKITKPPQLLSIVESAKRIMAPFIMLVGVIGVFGSAMILIICLHKCATMNKNRPQTQEEMELQQT